MSRAAPVNGETDTLPQAVMNFDDCLITHMAAVQMITTSIEETEDGAADEAMLDQVLSGQKQLLRDDRLGEDELAQRTATLMRSYSGAADTRVAEAEANDVSPQTLAATAANCAEAMQ